MANIDGGHGVPRSTMASIEALSVRNDEHVSGA
jgi:hypothetical protein